MYAVWFNGQVETNLGGKDTNFCRTHTYTYTKAKIPNTIHEASRILIPKLETTTKTNPKGCFNLEI